MHYSPDKFKELQDYLTQECQATISSDTLNNGNNIVKIQGRQGDTLTFTLYGNNTLLIQGRPIVLIIDTIQYLSESGDLSETELSERINEIFETKISVQEAQAHLEKEYPYAKQFAEDNFSKILSTAISMQSVPIALDDYTVISYPALRALEAFMKSTYFKATGDRLQDFSDMFHLVHRPSDYRLNESAASSISCPTTCELLEACYPHYNLHRHGTFHADSVDGATRIIEDRLEAIRISQTALEFINNYSKKLLQL